MYLDREQLGQFVRTAWVQWANEQPVAKPRWVKPWNECEEWEREVDRRIGEFVALRIREEQSQNECGRWPVWCAIDREYSQQVELNQAKTRDHSLAEWATLIGGELIAAAAESFSHYAFIRRLTRVAAYCMIAIEAAHGQAERASRGSSPAPASTLEVID